LSSPSDILLLNLRLANARNTNQQDYAVKSIISGPEHSSMNANKQSGIYHITSVDAASINHTTIAQAGQKRTLDEFLGRQKNEKTPVSTNIPDRRGAIHPTVEVGCFTALKAGEIQDVFDRSQSEYSQRRALALTPNPASNPLLDLSHPAYGLPRQLVKNFDSLGVKSIYPWQSDCLLRSGALADDRNLVYTAPTGGGKSLVADILMLKKIIETPEKKALLVLPYVALVQEKLRWLRKVVEGIKKRPATGRNEQRPSFWRKRADKDAVRVVGFFGGSKSKAAWADMDIAVCTIEKAWLRLESPKLC
jgi:hypothetical protein